jgi:hypothetical protein
MKKNNVEKRGEARVSLSCALRFRTVNSDKFYEANCVDLSVTGISFCSNHEFQVGEEVEVEVHPDPPIMFSTSFVIVIVRVERQENELFKMGARIDYE